MRSRFGTATLLAGLLAAIAISPPGANALANLCANTTFFFDCALDNASAFIKGATRTNARFPALEGDDGVQAAGAVARRATYEYDSSLACADALRAVLINP
ncbi:MAG: hypothetical protein V9G08_10335 [Dermatophilaceae bacterium]